jgi:two-component system, LuxR family, sensor kinase FixL
MPLNDKQTHSNDSLFHALIETAVDGIVVIDAGGLVQVYNSACQRLFGYSPDEIIGHNVKLLVPSPYHEGHDGYLTNYRNSGEKKIIGIGREVVGRRKDHSTFPMYLSVGEGELSGERIFLGIIHDLTERNSADDAVKEREARLRSILDTVPDAIVLIDETGTVESFSSAASRLFGYPSEDVVGENVKMLMPSPYREQHDNYLSHYRQTGERKVIGKGRIVVGLRRDGSTFPMELAVGEVLGGKRRLFTGFVRDLTERHGTEQRLQELQSELLHVSRLSAMGQMSAAIAHELNQPLTAILNYVKAAQQLLEKTGDTSRPIMSARDAVEKAASQTGRAGTIIQRLRDFVENREREKASESLNKTVEEAIALGFVGAADSNVKVKLTLDPAIPPVIIDKIQIQQVLINLIRNSIEAMADSVTRELTLSTSLGGPGFAQVTIRDTGPGLSSAVLASLFQPFVTTKDKGMGIGLTISQSIIEGHGGHISALQDGLPGAGFCMLLPLAPIRPASQ